jgi:cytochrome c551/c552
MAKLLAFHTSVRSTAWQGVDSKKKKKALASEKGRTGCHVLKLGTQMECFGKILTSREGGKEETASQCSAGEKETSLHPRVSITQKGGPSHVES